MILYIPLILEYLFWGLEFNCAWNFDEQYVPNLHLRNSQSQESVACERELRVQYKLSLQV